MGKSAKRSMGRLLVIGGAEDPDPDNLRVLPRLVAMSGGDQARVLVCSAPSAKAQEKVREYGKLLTLAGAAKVFQAPIEAREQAAEPALLEQLEEATAVFFTGGDQLRLTSLVAGTEFGDRVHERLFEEGLVVAGTSAGAAAMGSVMITGGPSEGTVRRSDVVMAPGLGLWRDVVVDTHFNQRGRVSRLLTVLAQNPQVLGIGLDENTAIELHPGERFTVVGAGTVMVFNGRISYTDAHEVGDETPIALADSALHVLTEGFGFDLRRKRPLLPDGTVVERARRVGEAQDR